MKNYELYVMRDGLNAVPNNVSYIDEKKKGIVNFKLAVSKNKRMLHSHLKDVEEAIEPSEDYSDYRGKEQELSKKFCRKDKDGKNIVIPIIEGTRKAEKYDIEGKDDPESDYSLDFKLLAEKFKQAIEERKKQMEKFDEFLEEESAFKPYMIPFVLVPDDIPQVAMDGVLFIIDEEITKKKKK